MEEAKKLIEELKELMGRFDRQSEERVREIAKWFGEHQDEETQKLYNDFMEDGLSHIETELVDIRRQIADEDYRLLPIGTYAHEFVQMYQGIDSIPLAYTNHYALEDWYDEYRGDNGTALTDTITTDLFLLDFNRAMVNNFNGVRHDSGDPYEWGEKIIAHYKKYGVDPKTKLLLFSDSLDFDKAEKLYQYFKDKTKVSFGIGTFVSNDTEENALNIVIKLQYVNGRPVAKLSDDPGKSMCRDEKFLDYLRRSVDFRLNRVTKP